MKEIMCWIKSVLVVIAIGAGCYGFYQLVTHFPMVLAWIAAAIGLVESVVIVKMCLFNK